MIKWFDSLDKKVRYSIVIVPWVLYLVFLIADIMALMVLSLIVAAITSLFAAISHDKKVKAKQAEEKSKGTKTTSDRTGACNFSSEDNDGITVRVLNFPIHTKVRGATFEGRQDFLRESEDGDELIIKHSPTPKYPDTIAVINERTGKQLGNVGADLAASLLDEFGEGCAFHGIIQEITGGDSDRPTLGCNFTIEGLEDLEQ